ncbi:hypothetical protein VTO73DRAFT_13454 [Trametes versicolor]
MSSCAIPPYHRPLRPLPSIPFLHLSSVTRWTIAYQNHITAISALITVYISLASCRVILRCYVLAVLLPSTVHTKSR